MDASASVALLPPWVAEAPPSIVDGLFQNLGPTSVGPSFLENGARLALRVLNPPRRHQIDFPANFGRRFVVCVDTEEEFDWSQPKRRDANTVEAIRALPVAHARLKAAGVRPAYLMDYPIASNPVSIDVVGELVAARECVIGAQLHPWVNPPFDEAVIGHNSFPGNLPRALERAKLAMLTDRLEVSFGERPIIYRAGRYGVGPNTESILDELGYRIDCSVRPLFDYSAEEGPSFWHAPAHPYWTGPERKLLEIPSSALFVGHLRAMGGRLFRLGDSIPHLRGVLARTGLLNRVVLTPEGMPLDETLRGLRALVDSGARVFSVAFHSPSVEPGHTPFVRDRADLALFYAWLDGVFGFFAREGISPSTPHDILAVAEYGREEEDRAARTGQVPPAAIAA